MKNKENICSKKQASLEIAGSELLTGSTIITKLAGKKVKLTEELLADIFDLIMNAQDDENDENVDKWEENIDVIIDFFENAGAEKHKDNNSLVDEKREELITLLTAYLNKCLLKLDDIELLKLSYGIKERKERQQLIN